MNLKTKLGKLILQSEPYIFFIPAIILYTFLVLFKLVFKKQIIFCGLTVSRIGHLSANTEVFLRRLKSGKYDTENNIYILFCNHYPVSNHQLFHMFNREKHIINSRIFKGIMNTFLKNTPYHFELPFKNSELFETFDTVPPILHFTPKEESYGRQLLTKMGIESTDWFVCFHARDSTYLGACRLDFRNSNIINYIDAMEYITRQGGYVIRMGSAVEKPLPTNNPRIIDYATKFRSDFMDIYLSNHCKFFVGDGCGINQVAQIFNAPVAWANVTPIQFPPYSKRDRWIPKKLWSVEKKRLLTIQETAEIVHYHSVEEFENAGIEVVENSPKEILDLVIEANETIDGTFVRDKEADELQAKFDSLLETTQYKGCPALIGSKFLKNNQKLIDSRSI